MGESGKEWGILANLTSTCITRITACLGREERQGALGAAMRVQEGLESRDYGALLDALDPGDAKIVHETDLIEQSILAILRDVRFYNNTKEGFKTAMAPYRKRIEEIAGAVARARSLDVVIDRTMPNLHDQLVDYVSRIALNRPIMTDNPKFWQWIETSYSGIDQLLKRHEKRRMDKTNSFVQMLSVQFKHRERSGDHMDQINSVCEKILGMCDNNTIEKYAEKMSESYGSAITEMKLHIILKGEFPGVKAEVGIPGSRKNSDLGFNYGNDFYFVEVYTSRTFTFVGPQSRYHVDFQAEWTRLLGKRQVQDLKKANERTVLVMNVGHNRLDAMETQTPKFREQVSAAMPETSEVVIIRGKDDIEVISVRGGKVVETTGLGRTLGSAIRHGWQ